MKTPLFTGCATAMVTPFDDSGKIDLPALERLIDRQLENGIDALVACGTTGEPACMEDGEWTCVLKTTVQRVRGRVPVIAGTGGNNTAHVIRQAAAARELGADAQLCVTPYYNKTAQAALIAYYTAIEKESSLPLIIYNVPSRTGLNMKPETFAAIKDLDGIIGVKEASGDAAQAADIASLCGADLPLYSGSDELTVQLRSLGGCGTVSVLSNLLPDVMHDMTHLPIAEAAQVQLKHMKLIRLLFSETNPIPVKAALALKGLCKNRLRLPLIPLAEGNRQALENEMRRLQIL